MSSFNNPGCGKTILSIKLIKEFFIYGSFSKLLPEDNPSKQQMTEKISTEVTVSIWKYINGHVRLKKGEQESRN